MSVFNLEDLILKHPAAAEAAMIGGPDPKWTERPLAVVVAKPGRQVKDEEIKAFLQDFAAKGIISRYGVPERIVFVEALPQTSVGKVDKRALRQPSLP